MKKILQIALAVALVAGIGTIALAQWNPPSGNAPSGNVDAPVHTGVFSQIKKGNAGFGAIRLFLDPTNPNNQVGSMLWGSFVAERSVTSPLATFKKLMTEDFSGGSFNNLGVLLRGLSIKEDGTVQLKTADTAPSGKVLTALDNNGTVGWGTVSGGNQTIQLPNGNIPGEVWTWNGSNQLWQKPIPDGVSNNQVLTWNGTAWVPAPAQGALPIAQNNQVLVYRTQTGTTMTNGHVVLQSGWQRVNPSPVYQLNAGCSPAGPGGSGAYVGEISMSPTCLSSLCSSNGTTLGYRSCYQPGGTIGAQCNVSFASGPQTCNNSPIRGAIMPQ